MKHVDPKEAKFFCESCGSEVPRKSKFCPTCGKFFASVKCPQCGKTGNPDEFKDGCPSCGYAVGKDMQIITGRTSSASEPITKGKKSNGIESGPPLWAYIVSILVLGVLVIALYSCL
ncbi:MAG: zinc ribbon domain-containing protein [Treponema sp.]|nr:zinc ribbon domain-containing protein [Treponema sp.]